jgi:hypothetical protein
MNDEVLRFERASPPSVFSAQTGSHFLVNPEIGSRESIWDLLRMDPRYQPAGMTWPQRDCH